MDKYKSWDQCQVDISDNDIFSAMKHIDGYIDITPADFKMIYRIAYQQAIVRLYQDVKAVDVMTQPVISVQNDTALLKTANLMAENNISGVPVIDGNQNIVGVISEKDFLREMSGPNYQSFMGMVAQCLNNKGCVAVSLKNKAAKEIMSSPPFIVQEDMALTQIAELFEKQNINRVPVVDKKNKLIGIVARSDIIQHFCTIPG